MPVDWATRAARRRSAREQQGARADQSLDQAVVVQAFAAAQGFDWPNMEPMWLKLDEEIGELREALAAGDPGAVQAELGDLLFMVVNIARACDVDPSAALESCIDKFSGRMAWIERHLTAQGERIEDHDLDQLEALWQAAKRVG